MACIGRSRAIANSATVRNAGRPPRSSMPSCSSWIAITMRPVKRAIPTTISAAIPVTAVTSTRSQTFAQNTSRKAFVTSRIACSAIATRARNPREGVQATIGNEVEPCVAFAPSDVKTTPFAERARYRAPCLGRSLGECVRTPIAGDPGCSLRLHRATDARLLMTPGPPAGCAPITGRES